MPSNSSAAYFATLLSSLVLAACAGPSERASAADAPLWTFGASAVDLRVASCPEGQPFTRAGSIQVAVNALDMTGVDSDGAAVSGWALSSDDPGFGGLSGMSVLPSGNLLTVSDAGAFVWITMADGVPTGEGHIAYMQGAGGEQLSGKRQGDAEGLALRDGLAFVSFERDHRILAFDLEGCGANALGVPVADIPGRPEGMGRTMRENGGLEGLAFLGDGTLAAAIETRDPAIPFARVRDGGALVIDGQISTFQAQAGTGIDVVDDRLFTVHRDFRPGSGNYITVSETPLVGGVPSGEAAAILSLEPGQPVDNMEGVAAAETDAGLRLYVLSDDNFNPVQRTLLLALDLN